MGAPALEHSVTEQTGRAHRSDGGNERGVKDESKSSGLGRNGFVIS